MALLLERLISAAFPLLTVVARKQKSKRVSRAAKKISRAASPRSKRRDVSRVKPKKVAPARTEKKQLHFRSATIAPARSLDEPERKPVPPTGRAILITPEDGKYVDTLNPTFRWLSVGGATRYEVWWGEENHNTAGIPLISISTFAAVPVEKPLLIGVTYQWRVRGGNEAGWGPWSPEATFRVVAEPLVS